MIRRTLFAISKMECCRNGDVVYSPAPRDTEYNDQQKIFDTTIEEWKEIEGQRVEEEVKKLAEEECKGMGTPRLCNFNFQIIRAEEIAIAPRYIIEQIEMLEKEVEKLEKSIERKQELIKTYKEFIDELKSQYSIETKTEIKYYD